MDSSRHNHPPATIKDYSIGAVWSVKDYDYIQKKYANIRAAKANRKIDDEDDETHIKLICEFERFLVRKLLDQTAYDERYNKYVEPIQIEYKEDLVTNQGLARMASLITGESTRIYTHYAAGIGNRPENRADTALNLEISRVSLVTTGYATAAGSSIKFSGTFPTGAPTSLVAEGGVFDTAVAGNMLFRTVYSTPLIHTRFETIFTLTQTIVFSTVS